MSSRKRQKLDFQPGNIKTVEVINFTTYSFGKFKLSPSLNMIIGPNGTGKSTLVSAICLGLGGKLDLIKRKTLKSMIKTGTTESTIKLVVADKHNEELFIERSFNEKSSKWKLNGKSSSEREVIARVKGLNIQLDNLCHFLPQERVAEFAGLSPEKLLLETQRTLKSGNLYIMHEDLIKLDEKRDSVMVQLNTYNDRKKNLEEEREKLDEAVNALNQFNEKRNQVYLHKMVLPYAIWEDEKKHRQQLKEKRDEAKSKLLEFEKNKNPLNDELKKSKDKIIELDNARQNSLQEFNTLKEKFSEVNGNREILKESISRMKEQLHSTKTSKQKRRQEIINEKAAINVAKNELKQLNADRDSEELDSWKEQRKQKNSELSNLNSQLEEINNIVNSKKHQCEKLNRDVNTELSKLNVEDKLNLLQDFRNNRLYTSAFQLHKFLRTNVEYQQSYFEAPFITCNLRERFLAGVTERVIGQNNLMALTFTNDHDYGSLSSSIKKYNSPVRIVKQQAQAAPVPRDQLKNYGFENYLCDYLQGPKEVINMLNVNAKLQLIPVTSKELNDQQIKRILTPGSDGRIPFMRFVSGQQLFTVTRSRYGNKNFVYSSETISSSNFFGRDGLSMEVRNEIEANLKSIKREIGGLNKEIGSYSDKSIELNAAIKRIQKDYALLQEKISAVSNLKSRINRIEASIDAKKKRIVKLTNEYNKDQTNRMNNIRKKIMEKQTMVVEAITKLSTVTSDMASAKLILYQIDYDILQETNRSTSIQLLINQIDEFKTELVETYERAKHEYATMRNSNARKQVEENNKSLSEEEIAQIQDLAVSYKEAEELTEILITDKISILEEEISVMTADKSAISRLKEVDNKLKEVDALLPRLNQEKQSYDLRITQIESRWEPKLTKLVDKISRSFQKKFVAVASNGQVQLSKSKKYKDWRLEILVKFREESELKILDRQSQSGGERAVSTIFFIMALQGLTEAPLRIVDEINQGMDPKNEKNAHKYLVHTACTSGTAQYFLVTPKLLTGLYYHPQMKIHCIYTGPLISPLDNKNDVDFMDFSKI